ncbi:MAG: DegV family protein [Clostridia bacterium]|jgi:DegV family protein with EDD domain|nr:DegV family protein [Clostridia bacterium]
MVKISADSTCDLGEYGRERNIAIMPLSVILGDKSYRDGVEIMPQDIFEYVEKTGVLPKTSAPAIADYEEFFARELEGGGALLHFNISAKSSSSYDHAAEAAKSFQGKVTVIDSKALSSGQGLLVMKASDLAAEGKGAEEIAAVIQTLIPKTNTSFVPDRLDYLYKGGRCSRMAMYGANLLKIHPLIEMHDGQLFADKRYRGNMKKCISNYIDDLAEQYPAYDETRCFITHSNADREIVDYAIEKTKSLFSFREICETVAGSVITGHCGRNTLGLLFIAR